MNPLFIETFLAVVRAQKISEAARLLFVSQSTVSERLTQLEEELGVTLIERKRGFRNISLTEKGEQFILLAERYVELEKEIDYFTLDKNEMHLSISAAPSVLTYMFIDLLQEMSSKENKLRLKLASPNAQSIYKQIDAFETDIGFVFFPQQYENVVTKPFLSEEMCLLLSPEGKWPDRPISPSELKKEHEVLARWSPEIEIWHDIQWPSQHRPLIRLEYANILGNMLSVDSHAWALAPKSMALRSKSVNPNLHIRNCKESIPRRICYMLVRKKTNEQTKRAIEMFLSHLIPFTQEKDYFTVSETFS